MAFVRAERMLGHESRLLTFGRSIQQREEDICLDLPFLDSPWIRGLKRFVTPKSRRVITNRLSVPDIIPRVWKPGNMAETLLFSLRERLWQKKINETIRELDIASFQVIQLDGGLGFYRDARLIQRMKEQKKTIICCYTGSDLRTRGVIPGIDRIADLNVTVEIDHLLLHPNIHHVPFPLDLTVFSPVKSDPAGLLIIGHAPTHREAKGSDTIIAVVKQLEKNYPVSLLLIEGQPYDRAIALKRRCQIFVDQIGDLGYGLNGVEALAMGIPTCTSLAPGFRTLYPDHPFLESDAKTLKPVLEKLIENGQFRQKKAVEGRIWVNKVHQATSVVQKIHKLAGLL